MGSADVVGSVNEEDDASDRGYIFCSDESLNKCWTGVELSKILQEESLKELGVKINLWAWRHIIIGIAKAHLEEIAPFFSKDEKACKELLETNIYYNIFAWQAGHQKRINVSIYGLDAAFPGKMQEALFSLYHRISRIWHHWLGLLKRNEMLTDRRRVIGEKRGLSMDTAAQNAQLANRQRWYIIESGRKTNITIDTLNRIAAALGVKAKDLLK